MEQKEGDRPQSHPFTCYLKCYPKRHIVLAVALVLLCTYYLLRELRPAADFITTSIAQPWHRFSGTVFGVFPFSVAEWLCVLLVAGALTYLCRSLYQCIREPEKLQRACASLVTLFAGALTLYALVCWLWGFGYYSHTFAELSGIEAKEVRVEDLKEATLYFAEAANIAGEEVNRDGSGVYTCNTHKLLSESPLLYTGLPEEFSFLEGAKVCPKPLVFSYLMSHTNFVGVFVPITGEANINTHAPDCFIPSTVAHELSHQRGVTREQDANFTAVLVCMESGSPDFAYSGALLAYTHLSSALRQASYEDWEEAQAHLGENARRDLRVNNEYWQQFQTPAANASETLYEEFLQNQGQELGMRGYGACVDLLVTYYAA